MSGSRDNVSLKRRQTRPPSRQRGAVLIVALVLLLVLTLLGTAGMQDTAMEERMAGNFRDLSVALQAAEAGLRSGEVHVSSASLYVDLGFDGSDGSYEIPASSVSLDPEDVDQYLAVTDDQIATNNDLIKDEFENSLLREAPAFYVERLPEISLPGSDLTIGFPDEAPRIQFYRVTGRGAGISPNTEVILQSTYFR